MSQLEPDCNSQGFKSLVCYVQGMTRIADDALKVDECDDRK